MYFGEHGKISEREHNIKPTTGLGSENVMWKSLEKTIVSGTASGSAPWNLQKVLEREYRYQEDLCPVLNNSPTDNSKHRLGCLAFS